MAFSSRRFKYFYKDTEFNDERLKELKNEEIKD